MTTPHRRQQMAEASARLKAKRKEAGLVRVEVWVHPDDLPKITALAEKLRKKRVSAD